jgi:hypothetical protein
VAYFAPWPTRAWGTKPPPRLVGEGWRGGGSERGTVDFRRGATKAGGEFSPCGEAGASISAPAGHIG